MDDPEMQRAIEAARALSKIAPDAPHAQHMTSHIFIALGLWDDLVQANEEAVRVVYRHAREQGKPEVSCFHYNEWLEYGYFQQGRYAEAKALLLACERSGRAALASIGDPAERDMLAARFEGSLPIMRATGVIESQDWNGAAVNLATPASTDSPGAAIDRFVAGYAAAQRGDKPVASRLLKELHAQVSASKRESEDPQTSTICISSRHLAGLVRRRTQARAPLRHVRAAAARLDGRPSISATRCTQPPHELLGEML